jgi:ribosomal protein S27AE
MPSLATAYYATKAARTNRDNPKCSKCGDFGFYEAGFFRRVRRCECGAYLGKPGEVA